MESAQQFTGYVRKILPPSEYGAEFVVANYKSETVKENMRANKKFPVALKIKANIKNGASKQLESISEGDKVIVEFYLGGIEGVSKSTGKYYAINELMLAKQKGITVLERAEREEPQTEESPDDDDIPF